jgi:hypothetical protein
VHLPEFLLLYAVYVGERHVANQGLEGWGSVKCCLPMQFCPCITLCCAYSKLSEHYGVTNDQCCALKAGFCPCLAYSQLFDTILLVEQKLQNGLHERRSIQW